MNLISPSAAGIPGQQRSPLLFVSDGNQSKSDPWEEYKSDRPLQPVIGL